MYFKMSIHIQFKSKLRVVQELGRFQTGQMNISNVILSLTISFCPPPKSPGSLTLKVMKLAVTYF